MGICGLRRHSVSNIWGQIAMVEEAQAPGADTVVMVRYSTSAVMQGAAEVIAFDTAVKHV